MTLVTQYNLLTAPWTELPDDKLIIQFISLHCPLSRSVDIYRSPSECIKSLTW